MIDNAGKLISPNNICNVLNNDKSPITRKTVSKYISYFENSFMFYKAKRYDIQGKKYLTNNDKYYLCDMGLNMRLMGLKYGLRFGDRKYCLFRASKKRV